MNYSKLFKCKECTKDIPCLKHVEKATSIHLQGWIEPVDGIIDMAGPTTKTK